MKKDVKIKSAEQENYMSVGMCLGMAIGSVIKKDEKIIQKRKANKLFNVILMKKIIISICCILCLCACTNQKENSNSGNQLEKEITENLNKIGEVSDTTSSNPYDYTNNEYYKNIIKIGKKAVPVLEEMYKDNKLSGVYAYISALAIEELTDCNLYEEYNLDWSTADEFYTLWKDYNCGLKN